MARFNRTRLIEQLREMAERQQKCSGFDHNSGTAQLRPRPSDDAQDELIDRAVSYGRWRALQDMVEDLESGHAGT